MDKSRKKSAVLFAVYLCFWNVDDVVSALPGC